MDAQSLESARDDALAQFSKLVAEYSAVYENFASFFKNVKAFPQFSREDQAIFDGLCEDYDAHYSNLKTLDKELLEVGTMSQDDLAYLLEAGQEVVGLAACFVLDLPERIQGSSIGADVPF